MTGSKRFKLGTFSSNCSGGMSITTVPEKWRASWDNNLALARMLDAAGMDFMLPVARWIGWGGESGFHGEVLETLTWAAGLLAATQNISVIATVHAAAFNPVVLAKQMATIDQIGHGRSGINIVAGWNKPEFEALGLSLPDDHAVRYAYAQEWFEIVRRLWTSEDPFDFDGEFFTLKAVHGSPLPFDGPPPVLNAAGSGIGRQFATRNADFLFTPAIDLDRSKEEIAELKALANTAGRSVDVLTFSHVVCRPTTKEAEDYVQYFGYEHRDDYTLDRVIEMQFAHAQSFPHDLLTLIRNRFAVGHGGYPLIGTPEQVADGICAIHEAGFGGTTLSFVDYVAEFPYFRDTVLPLLDARGLRPA
ncbi:LLM class flavin-dependent oxidoreductase [Sphingobium terrigena]|nr:LLM class flavin-dependent oxidoreductase [Sphingobium terrigena]